MKMVDTGQTSSDGPAVVPHTEWNLDEEQKDLRRESRKNCKWFKANLIILFIAIALTGTWISSLQQSVNICRATCISDAITKLPNTTNAEILDKCSN